MPRLTIKFCLKQLLFVVVCSCCAAYLRMCFPLMSYQYWPQLISQSARSLVGALIGMPLFELTYFGSGYLLAIISFTLIAWRFLSKSASLTTFLVVGMAQGAGWYLILAFLTNSLWRHEGAIILLGVYSTTGILYGFLFYQWIIKRPRLA